MTSVADLAYAAGIIDGEGCVLITKWKSHRTKLGLPTYEARITVNMTDKCVLDKMQSLFGGSLREIKSPSRQDHWKRQWTWTVASRKAEACAIAIYPYIVAKKKQIEYLLLFRDTVKGASGNKYNLLLPEVVGLREALQRAISAEKKKQDVAA